MEEKANKVFVVILSSFLFVFFGLTVYCIAYQSFHTFAEMSSQSSHTGANIPLFMYCFLSWLVTMIL
jgi:hypothetical protein